MRKIDQLKNKLTALTTEAQNLIDEGKVAEARAKMSEVKDMKDAIEMQEALDKEEEEALKAQAAPEAKKVVVEKQNKSANSIRAMIKKVSGRQLTEQENALLVPAVGEEGANGESYILPEDISTKIRKKIREYRSLTDVVGYMPAGALTGSFPVENFETVSELIDFTDGTDGEFSDDIKFKNVSYALKEKAAFIKLSNTLLQMTDNDLIAYVVEVFAKKAVITENKMIIEKLQEGKTVKDLADWNALRKSINTDLDPAALNGTVIVTNQDGFEFLDSQMDGNGRPILEPNPTNPTQKRFKGYTIVSYSNSMLPTVKGKAPIFYGNLSEAVKFVDYKGLINFATSTEAGFMSNTTLARLIEFIDVVKTDNSDKLYISGAIAVTE